MSYYSCCRPSIWLASFGLFCYSCMYFSILIYYLSPLPLCNIMYYVYLRMTSYVENFWLYIAGVYILQNSLPQANFFFFAIVKICLGRFSKGGGNFFKPVEEFTPLVYCVLISLDGYTQTIIIQYQVITSIVISLQVVEIKQKSAQSKEGTLINHQEFHKFSSVHFR